MISTVATGNREQKRIQKLTPRVTALYEKDEMLLAEDKDLFVDPVGSSPLMST
jgi:hypothetical protein